MLADYRLPREARGKYFHAAKKGQTLRERRLPLSGGLLAGFHI